MNIPNRYQVDSLNPTQKESMIEWLQSTLKTTFSDELFCDLKKLPLRALKDLRKECATSIEHITTKHQSTADAAKFSKV